MKSTLPTAPDAERSVIAEILATNGDALMDAEFLKADYFAERVNREIFDAAKGAWESGGRPDATVIAEVLRDSGSPVTKSTVDGYVAFRGSPEAFTDSARIVETKWLARQVIGVGEEIAHRAVKDSPYEVIDAAEASLSALRPTRGTGLTRILGGGPSDGFGKVARVATGFDSLDAYLGGLVGGRLITLASRPGVGKTTLAFDIASNAAEAGSKVAAFSLEMSTDELTERLIYKASGVPQYKFKSGKLEPEEVQQVAAALLKMQKWSLYIDDSSGMSAYEITAKAKKLKHEQGLDLVIVDYVQLVSAAKADNREQEVAAIVRAFKYLARDLGVPVLMLSQLSRAAEVRGGKPRMSDLRESGGIENDADQIITLWREEENNDGEVAYVQVCVIKNRHGSSGDLPNFGLVRGLSKFDDNARF